MKILHINCADYGSTGKIIDAITYYASKYGDNSFLCCANKKAEHNNGLEVIRTSYNHQAGLIKRLISPFGIRYGFSPYSTHKIIRKINELKPDIIHIHSVNRYMVNLYRLLDFIGRKKIPTIITNHAEFFYTGNCAHAFDCDRWKTGCGKCPNLYLATGSILFDCTHYSWKRMYKSLHNADHTIMVSVSPWVSARAERSPICEKNKKFVILNGIDTDTFTFFRNNFETRKALGISNEKKVLIYVTANFSNSDTDIKGGKYILELADKLKNSNIIFVVVGPCNINFEIPSNIKLIGTVYDQNYLSKLYSMADLTVITSRRETYSMPVAESLCCGTPVVGFEAGGPESIAIEEYSQFIEYGNVEKMKNVILEWLNKKQTLNCELISETAKTIYDATTMASQYYELYKYAIEREYAYENRNTDIS